MTAAFAPFEQETYCFYLVPGFSAMGFVAAMEPLRVANRLAQRPVFAWRLFSADGEPVAASCGLKVAVDGPLDETAAALIVCAGFEPRRAISRPLVAALRRMARKGAALGALDTGVYLLAEAGLIGDQPVTLHWEAVPAFREDYPAACVTEDLFCLGERLFTCAGGTAAIDMMLERIALRQGPALARAVSDQFIHSRIRPHQRRSHPHPTERRKGEQPKMAKLVNPLLSGAARGKANGQVYGGGERTEQNQMPVEESGNLLILMAAIAQMEGNANFAGLYWKQLEQWAEYLKAKGFDPENQLCTDDFSGALGHNVNLSAKAIMGIAGFAQVATALGHAEDAARYRATAETFAEAWLDQAKDSGGTRLAFDQAGSWSLKYNLVWDRLLGLNLFPEAELRREQDFYRGKAEIYGVPLDGRGTLTKPEWMLWAACLTDDAPLLRDWTDRILRYANETPNRVPLSDLYLTESGRKIGFQARSVVGGLYVALLARAWQV